MELHAAGGGLQSDPIAEAVGGACLIGPARGPPRGNPRPLAAENRANQTANSPPPEPPASKTKPQTANFRSLLGRGLKSCPQPDCDEGEGAEVVPGELVVSGGDASGVLEAIEAALDQISLSVKLGFDAALDELAAGSRHVRISSETGDGRQGLGGIVAAVGNDVGAGWDAVEQLGDGMAVMGLPG
jgi:hypothetical protein